MGQLGDAANRLEKLAPNFLDGIRKLANKGDTGLEPDDNATNMDEAPLVAEEQINEDYQLKNIKRLIKKTNK